MHRDKSSSLNPLTPYNDPSNTLVKRFKSIVEESIDGFAIVSLDGTVEYINESLAKMFNIHNEKFDRKSLLNLCNLCSSDDLRKMLSLSASCPEESIRSDIAFEASNSNQHFIEVIMKNFLDDPFVNGIVVNFRDVTDRVEMERNITYISNHDDLTGLPNSRYLKSHLKSVFENTKMDEADFALMIIDVDGFKYVNDAVGYELADEVIVKISEKIKSAVESSWFLSRHFGVQFAVVVENKNSFEEYKQSVEMLFELFSETLKIQKYELDINATIGVTISREDTHDAEALIREAQSALCWAKLEGKNRYKFYSPKLDFQDSRQFELRNDLRKAIEEDQFELHYQPIVKISTGETIAAEALIRWNHPVHGRVSPLDFIYLAEETGLIVELGNWILRDVCSTYRNWLDAGLPPIKISVNFSSIQFLEENFVENIKSSIAEYDLDSSFLVIEITENVFMKNVNKVVRDIQSLQSIGIQIALDDFGTGFSSLAYLNNFNIDILKTDKFFIEDMVEDSTNDIIFKSVIELSKALDIKVVVEGIEYPEQLHSLMELDCFAGQGYLYSKPLSESDFEAVLAKKHCSCGLNNCSNLRCMVSNL